MKAICENQLNDNKFIEEIGQNIADIKRYSKRKCYIEESKLKLATEKYEFKKKIELKKSNRQMAQLDIQKNKCENELFLNYYNYLFLINLFLSTIYEYI